VPAEVIFALCFCCVLVVAIWVYFFRGCGRYNRGADSDNQDQIGELQGSADSVESGLAGSADRVDSIETGIDTASDRIDSANASIGRSIREIDDALDILARAEAQGKRSDGD